MQKGSIRFEDCMKTGKLNYIKPNYIRKSRERNLGRWGTLPAERDLPNISRCLCCSRYKLEQLKVIPEKQLSRSLGFFTKSNLFLYFASLVFYHTEMCYYSETVGVSVCSSWAGVDETGVRAGVRAGTGAYFVGYIFGAGKYEHPQSSVLLYRLAKSDFYGFLPLMFAFFKGYFFSFMYKTPSPCCVRWEKAFTSPRFEFFCGILFFI